MVASRRTSGLSIGHGLPKAPLGRAIGLVVTATGAARFHRQASICWFSDEELSHRRIEQEQEGLEPVDSARASTTATEGPMALLATSAGQGCLFATRHSRRLETNHRRLTGSPLSPAQGLAAAERRILLLCAKKQLRKLWHAAPTWLGKVKCVYSNAVLPLVGNCVATPRCC